VILLDGDRLMPGCVCTSGCEFPCWQRIGIDDEPCCAGCAPLGGEAPARQCAAAQRLAHLTLEVA